MAEQNRPAVPFQRRTIFIKKSLQLRYMLLMVTCVLCGLAIMGMEIAATLNDLFGAYPVLMQPIYDEFVPIVSSFFYKIAIYILLIIIISAIISHRMAGPVYRFEQTCKAIAKGDFSQRVHLRKGDRLTDLQKEFNHMMDVVEDRIRNKPLP